MSRTLLRGAQVSTMSANRPDWERIDVLIDGDQIAGLGRHLQSDDAHTIDLAGRVLIPGLVNAHLHSWQTALRGVGVDWTLPEYFTHVHAGVATQYTPEDVRIGTLAGALNQINCGTTTLGDWSHNNRTPEHADAAIESLSAAGIRGVFFYGTPYAATDAVYPVGEIDRLLAGRFSCGGLLTLGMAIKGPQFSPAELAVADCRAAHERGLVVTMHQSGGEPADGWAAVHDAGLFGPSTNVAHGAGLTDEWVKVLVDAGVTFTATPENELSQGHADPITGRLLELGSAPSLGTDVESVVSGDVLTAARVALAHQRGLDHDRHRRSFGTPCPTATITSKQALEWATVEGARALGLADRVGRIEPGMQADLVVIDARQLNLWPMQDPIAAALHAGVGNIEAVMIGGTWRKRDHQLVGVDLDDVKDRLLESGQRLRAKLETVGSHL
ncbi:MAG TPA: amidohydrolase family protein [Nocardioidaceae bacterium]|nr:amidohydrolase family protein [Nocardioidaceae bacterium]